MIRLLALATSTSDSLNSTFSGQVQIETECARQRKISLQRRCEVYFPFFSFLFLSSTILLLLSLFVRCTTLRPNDFTLVSGGFCVSARDYVRIYRTIGACWCYWHKWSNFPLFAVLCQSGVVVSRFCGSVVSFFYERSIRKMCFVLTCMCRWESVRVYGESYFGFSILYFIIHISAWASSKHTIHVHIYIWKFGQHTTKSDLVSEQ